MIKPFVIGIAGGSGSGKTTLARALQNRFGADRAHILAQDSYYIDQSHRFDGDGGSVNFDHPSSLEFSLMARHIAALKRGETVAVPHYDFPTHTRKKETTSLAPSPLIIVEGILIFSQPEVVAELDLAVFVDAPEPVRFSRRLKRDVQERGRTPEGVKKQFDLQVKPMHDQFVEPSKQAAGLVVSGETAIETELKQLLARLPLRP